MNDFMQGLRDMVKDDEEYATDLSKKTEIKNSGRPYFPRFFF